MDFLPSRAANRIFLIVSTVNISFKSSLTPIRQTAWLKVGQFCTPITPESGSFLHADLHLLMQ
jgi:hypothetical protein